MLFALAPARPRSVAGQGVKNNNDGCFQLKQRVHVLLFEALKLVFKTSRKITTEKDLYNQFSVSSKADIQTVINFFSFIKKFELERAGANWMHPEIFAV